MKVIINKSQWEEIGKKANWIKIAKGEFDYAWLSLPLPKELTKEVINYGKDIPEEDLYIAKDKEKQDIHGKDWKFGRETNIHITVKWGIKNDDKEQPLEVFKNEKGGEVELGEINYFDNDDYDVLIIEVKSKDLTRLNKKSEELECKESSHKEYKPHVTIAYLKKGLGDNYKGNKSFKGKIFKFNEILFEDSNDKGTNIKLVK